MHIKMPVKTISKFCGFVLVFNAPDKGLCRMSYLIIVQAFFIVSVQRLISAKVSDSITPFTDSHPEVISFLVL